jgi:hypothetical protein
MRTIIVSTPYATQSNFFNTFSFPVAKRVMATTISSNLVQVIPMSYRYVITYKIKYSGNVFVKSEETVGVYQISLNNDYKLENVLKIMNENKSSSEIEKMIEDKNNLWAMSSTKWF